MSKRKRKETTLIRIDKSLKDKLDTLRFQSRFVTKLSYNDVIYDLWREYSKKQ